MISSKQQLKYSSIQINTNNLSSFQVNKELFMKTLLKVIFSYILVCLLLCGCVDTPDTLKEEQTKSVKESVVQFPNQEDNNCQQSNKVTAGAITQIEQGDLVAIRNQLNLDMQNTYQNITITSARVSDAEVMPTYDIKIGMKPGFTLDCILERLYSDRYDFTNNIYYRHHRIGEPINKDLPVRNEPEYTEDGEDIWLRNVYDIDIDTFAPDYNKDATLSVIMYSTGNIFGSESGGGLGNGNDWYNYTDRKIHKQYYLKNEQPSSAETYTMVDGREWNALEAIEFVEDFWQECIKPSDSYNFSYSVKGLYVVEIDDSHFAYLFEMQRQDEPGNYFDVDKTEFYIRDQSVLAGEQFIYTNRLVTYCAEKESISRFGKDFSFDLSTPTNEGDNILSLGAATDLLSEALASNVNLNLTAELNYMVVCKGYHCGDGWIKKYFYSDLCLRECDFEIRPYWCFKPTGQCFLINELEAERYYVDANSGEVSAVVNGKYLKYEER